MGDEDFIDISGADPKPFHGNQGRSTAVQENLCSGSFDQNAGLQTASAAEGITTPEKFNRYGFHVNLWVKILA